MNSVITLPRLFELVAMSAGTDRATADKFVRQFFDLLRSSLINGESVKIKGIGTFSPSAKPGKFVDFMPDKELAEGVNAPFAIFESVELDDRLTDADLAQADNIGKEEPTVAPPPFIPEEMVQLQQPVSEAVSESVSEAVATPLAELTQESPVEPEAEAEPEPSMPEEAPEETIEETQPEEIPEAPIGQTSTSVGDEADDTEGEIDDGEYPSGTRYPIFWMIWAAVIGLLIGFATGYFLHDKIEAAFMPQTADEEELMDDAQADTVLPIVDSIPAPEPMVAPAPVEVYDTITRTRYLTTMARDHYGKTDYWVYIYLENSDILKNPETARPGTPVKIPPVEKYATAPTDSANLIAARILAREIYSGYH